MVRKYESNAPGGLLLGEDRADKLFEATLAEAGGPLVRSSPPIRVFPTADVPGKHHL
jgi:hypothetical protein